MIQSLRSLPSHVSTVFVNLPSTSNSILHPIYCQNLEIVHTPEEMKHFVCFHCVRLESVLAKVPIQYPCPRLVSFLTKQNQNITWYIWIQSSSMGVTAKIDHGNSFVKNIINYLTHWCFSSQSSSLFDVTQHRKTMRMCIWLEIVIHKPY